MDIGVPELIIVLLIVLLLFGPERLGKTLGELGKGVRSFREGMSGKDDDKPAASNQVKADPVSPSSQVKAEPATKDSDKPSST